jgi:hypothetical protein
MVSKLSTFGARDPRCACKHVGIFDRFAACDDFFPSSKGKIVDRSLTVLLPVRDAQATLIHTVTAVLEVAADMADRLELLIIDDGSKDATGEVARELTKRYPQIRALGHATPMGRAAALRLGLAQSRGDVVYTVEPGTVTLTHIQRFAGPTRPNFLGRARSAIRQGF